MLKGIAAGTTQTEEAAIVNEETDVLTFSPNGDYVRVRQEQTKQ